MDFRQLEVFVTIVEEGNFSKAAKRLYLTQPTVSAHVDSLERECGMKLFERRNRQAVLTEAGQNFYPYAVDLLDMKERAHESFARFNQEIDGKITINASQTPGIYLLPNLLAPYQKKYPRSSFRITISDTDGVFENILNYEADLGFVGSPKTSDKLVAKPLINDQLVLIADSPFKEKLDEQQKKQGVLYMKDLLDLPFIIRTEGSATRKVFEKTLAEQEKSIKNLQIAGQVDNLEGVKSFVHQGVGVSFVSKFSLNRDTSLKSFYIQDLMPERKFYLIYHKDRVFSPTCERFIAHVQDQKI
ncbi:selenium metabolism-associated LysR family transcriptional regulator [Natranaerobius thermophilus]|uniref:Transcriptional regulator, LysR family n=1 Tax=Natranaerobius thermophilus (strain ATCC BAA-1301 / DSM 18059 / JW/NM-WN-LF) TaxID=457570 RepID=B2A0Q8_NATTJ|nr:selenium metabolism-associated LysR family transcriptional regulator [Natranaerobius thermophilus]ACB85938.1 transcriptional regulator, LysR family [Natranaerobius thermophilus JW/NM-WN-LF]